MTPERPSDPETRKVDVLGHAVSVTDEGEGVPVVLVHGLPGGARDWRWFTPAVAGRCVRIEQPGFGGTPRAAMPEAGFAARARWHLAVCEAMGLERFAVVGHSIGGPLAMAMAALAPERVVALGLIASVGVTMHRGYRRARPMRALAPLMRVPGLAGPMRGLARRAFERFGFRGHSDEALAQTLRVVSALSFEENRRFAEAVKAKTLVAWSGDDPILERQRGEELGGLLPAGPRLYFDTGGHNLQKSRAVETGQALTELLAVG